MFEKELNNPRNNAAWFSQQNKNIRKEYKNL
jgi:hypothetical protein